jgi:hypothetical protein
VTTVGWRRLRRFALRDGLVAGLAGVVAALVVALYCVSALETLSGPVSTPASRCEVPSHPARTL